jgi:hypothetical protein
VARWTRVWQASLSFRGWYGKSALDHRCTTVWI